MTTITKAGPELAFALHRVTEDAAIAAFDWIGRGEKEKGDLAAVDAMRSALGKISFDGVIVIGEGEKDNAPALYNGEQVGQAGAAFKADIAVDPIEGTTYMAHGLNNSLAVIAVSPRGTMMDPGPAFYMDKIAVGPEAKGKIDPEAPTKDKLTSLAKALSKDISDVTVYILDRPRHKQMIQEIREAGARAQLYPAGDVAGALLAAIPDSGVDALLGTGGTPEGIMCAAAIRALGGDFFGRFDPQGETEAAAVKDFGLDTTSWHKIDELVKSDEVCFVATGITDGLLVEGAEVLEDTVRLQTMMITGNPGEWQILTTNRPRP